MKKIGKKKPFAKKSFGQNFLIDEIVIQKIIENLNPKSNEIIFEIGPGRGALTENLVEKAGNVVAIELDKDLVPLLADKFYQADNFVLVQQDALKTDFRQLFIENRIGDQTTQAKLVANLPYNISTAILQHLIEYRECFSEMILMLQKEVVDRITAQPGNKERGYLTVLIEMYFDSVKLFDVPPQAFFPAPKVQSSVVRITNKIDQQNASDNVLFIQLISKGFRQKRKTLVNNLKNSQDLIGQNDIYETLEQAMINPKSRAEDLSTEEWVKLADLFFDPKRIS